jgi:hypothetical protein
MMKKATSPFLAVFLALALLLFLVPAASAHETAYEMDLRQESQDPSFHREFGIYYDQANDYVYVSDSLRNRIIKTHMPAQLIPHSDLAKYIYVTRHPVSCFASCVDFIYKGMGPLTPTRRDMLAWFCSDDMWWMSWPDHVESWWQRSQQHANVLFMHYEDLKRDLEGGVRQVAAFLEVPLTDAQVAKVVHKAGFDYMREHEEEFEMFAPNLFSVSTPENIRYMQSGSLDRHQDTDIHERERILAFCRERLAHASYPVRDHYPDVLAPPLISSP